MKLIALIFSILLFVGSAIAQDFFCNIRSDYRNGIKKENISIAKTLIDINPGYPDSWIGPSAYLSTEIITTTKAVNKKAAGQNVLLSEDQLKLLAASEIGTTITMIVKYQIENSATNKLENRTLDYTVTIVPMTEAQFPGGQEELSTYLQKTLLDKLSSVDLNNINLTKVKFTINEQGAPIDLRFITPTGNLFLDQIIRETINEMPKWQPAKNALGRQVKQDFEFFGGNEVGC